MHRFLTAWKEPFVLLCSAAFCCLITGFFLYEPMREKSFWVGENGGWLQVAPAIGTFIAALIAAGLAWENYLAGLSKEVSERFQKGVQLLAEDKASTQTGAMAILQDAAMEKPRIFAFPMAATLSAFITENSDKDWLRTYESLYQNRLVAKGAGTPLVVREALITLSHTPDEHRWPRTAAGAERSVDVLRPYCEAMDLAGVNFRKINMYYGVFRQLTWFNCTFIDCTITGVTDGLTFIGGTMQNCEFVITKVHRGIILRTVDVHVVNSSNRGAPIPSSGDF